MWNFKGSSHLANDTRRSCLLATRGKRLELSVPASSQMQFCQIKQRRQWVRNVLPVIVWVMTSSKSHKTPPSHSIIRPFCSVLTSANKHGQTSARSIGKKEKKKSIALEQKRPGSAGSTPPVQSASCYHGNNVRCFVHDEGKMTVPSLSRHPSTIPPERWWRLARQWSVFGTSDGFDRCFFKMLELAAAPHGCTESLFVLRCSSDHALSNFMLFSVVWRLPWYTELVRYRDRMSPRKRSELKSTLRVGQTLGLSSPAVFTHLRPDQILLAFVTTAASKDQDHLISCMTQVLEQH